MKQEEIYVLYYGSGEYEDYSEYDLFYGDKEFIEQKLKEGNELLNYLDERVSKFYDRYENVYDVINKYLKKLGLPYTHYDNIHIGMKSIRSFEQVQKKYKGVK